MFTLTCLSTSRMPSCLEAFFLSLSAWGNRGGGGGGGGGGGLFFYFSRRFGHWLLNFHTTPQGDNGLDFIHFWCRLAEKA